jgi:hypothetical protein
MENGIEFIDEETYQQIKKEMCKTDDYFSEKEKIILMQFLMQRQRKVIKKYKKI